MNPIEFLRQLVANHKRLVDIEAKVERILEEAQNYEVWGKKRIEHQIKQVGRMQLIDMTAKAYGVDLFSKPGVVVEADKAVVR